MMTRTGSGPSTLSRWLPGLRRLRHYQAACLGPDIGAGITLGMVMVPVGLAFGELAGLPMAGLYAGLLPLVVYALFGSSRQLILSPDAAMATLVAVSVAPLAGGDAARLVTLAAMMALLIGLACCVAGLVRLGFLADFLARPVVTGFMHGLAIIIVVGQLPRVFGFAGEGTDTVEQAMQALQRLGDTHWPTFSIALACVLLIQGLRRWAPRIPGQVVAIVMATAATRFWQLDERGVSVVGVIPRGLPEIGIPTLSLADLQALAPIAAGAALVAFSDTVVTARAFAARNRYRIDASQELLALGLGNMASALTQGLPVSGSGSRTAVAEAAGSRTQVTALAAVAVLAAVLLFLTPLLTHLPHAALGAILLLAAWNLCDFREFRRLWHFRLSGLFVCVVVLAGVVGLGVMEGILIGVLLSLVLVMQALTWPHDAVLGRMGASWHDRHFRPDATPVEGVLVYRFSGPLFFANSGHFLERIEALADACPAPPRRFVLDASAISGIDLAGCEALREVRESLQSRGIRLVIVHMRAHVRERLGRSALPELLDADLYQQDMDAAVDAQNL